MSIMVRARRQSHPPNSEDELLSSSPRSEARAQATGKPPLLRAKTLNNFDKNRPALSSKMSHVDMVEDLLQCHLCNKRLRRPKMLPCQHTFCLECLQGLAPPASKNLACPSCGLNVELQTAGPDGVLVLPPNLYLDSLLTALQQDNGGSAGVDKTRCSRCQTVGSTSACQHCRQVFCTVCWSSHISELKSQLPSLLDQLTGARERLDHRIQDFREVCQKLKQHIDVAVEVRIQSLRVQQSNMNKKAEELLAQGELSVAELQGRIHTTENTVARGADFDALPNDNKKVALFLQLHRTTSGLLDEVSHWGEARPTFDEENFRIDMAGESRTSSEPEEPDDVFCEAGPLSSADSMSLYYRSRSFTPRINLGRSVMQRPSGVGVAPWDDGVFMYIAGTDSRQVLVIDRSKMKLVTQLTAPSMLYPHGIAFCKTSREVYVTDKWNHCIHVFSAESKYLRQLGRKGHASGCFHSPEGIASGPGISEKTSLYVCDTGNDRVQVIDPSDGSVELILGILEPLPGQKTKRTQFNQPTGVAVTQDKVVVADFGNKRIKTYSLSGEKLNEFGSMGEARGQFRSPECIAVDRLGFILVGDSGNARVQIFRPNGTLVRVFGGRGSSAGRFAWVSGIAVTDSMDIIVTDSKNGNVQIF